MAEINSKSIVWETHDIRIELPSFGIEPVITLLGKHSDDMLATATRAIGEMLSGNPFVPLDNAGFQWMAGAIRLAWSKAHVAELSRRLSQYECVYHESPVDGCDDCAKHQVDEEWENPTP